MIKKKKNGSSSEPPNFGSKHDDMTSLTRLNVRWVPLTASQTRLSVVGTLAATRVTGSGGGDGVGLEGRGGCGSSYKNRPYFWSSSAQKNGASPGWRWGFHFPPHGYHTLATLTLLPNAKVRAGKQEEEEWGRLGSSNSCPVWSQNRDTGAMMADLYHIYLTIYKKKTV